jgi:hypothetical protein
MAQVISPGSVPAELAHLVVAANSAVGAVSLSKTPYVSVHSCRWKLSSAVAAPL